jgi:hypothetical protein
MTSHILLSSESQEWQSPPWFLDMVREVSPTGAIDLDPASAPNNPTRARRFYAPYSRDPVAVDHFEPGWMGPCGLAGGWPADGFTYVNPVYGPHLTGPVSPDYEIKRKGAIVGVGRGWGARIAEHRGETIAMLPARTDAAWFRAVFAWADLALFWSSPEHGARIDFVDPATGKVVKGSNLASLVLYRASEDWRRRHEGRDRFRKVFGAHGTMVVGGATRSAPSQLALGGAT